MDRREGVNSMDAATLLPHQPPMRAIDTLRDWTEDRAVAITTFAARDYGVEEGLVIEPMLVELVAQTAAAHQGLQAQSPKPGLLAAIDDFEFLSPVRQEWELSIHIEMLRKLGPFHIVAGRIFHGDDVVARGRLKLYVEEDGDASETDPSA